MPASKKTAESKSHTPQPRSSFEEAFEATSKARAQLAADQLLGINLDVQGVLATVLGALPRLRTLREPIEASLKDFDVDSFDAIQSYAEALGFAHTGYLAASQPTDVLPQLVQRATVLRDLLVSDATALARRNLVDGKRLAELKGGTGYLAVGSDVGVLVRMLRERWNEIQSKSPIQKEELDEAESLYERITIAHASRAQPGASAVAATDDRQRAYTLLVNAYDQARRAATYLRWTEGDADKIVPSLYAGRRGVRGSQVAEEEESHEEIPVAPAEPVVAPGPVVPVDSGLPGDSPFL